MQAIEWTRLSVAAEEPPELGGLLVPDGISATLIALPTMKTSHPTQELSALTLCCRGVVRVQRCGDASMGNSSFPSGDRPQFRLRLLLLDLSR